MPQSLGSIFVNLDANVAGFVSAMSKAAAEAQNFSKEVSRQFRDLGEVASQTFGAFGEQFNPVISQLSFVLSSAGSAASSAMKELRGLGGAIGPLAALGAGAAVGAAAAGVTLVGLAMHAAEAGAKLNQLSQSTGVPVETLSGLSYAAKAVDVDVQTLATGLERMSKSAEAAATSPAGATTAYSRLGIAVRDASGQVRPAEAIFLDLAEKFSGMQDGVEKTALAMQIFGRGGAAFIPMLNLGKAAIGDLIDYATKVGAVLSGPAAEAAEQFERTLAKIEIAAQGVANSIMVQLLPALQAVANSIASTGAQGNTFGKDFLSTIEGIIKGGIAIGETWITAFEQVGLVIKHVGADILLTVGGAWDALKRGSLTDFFNALSGRTAEAMANQKIFADDSKQLWANNAKFISDVYGNIKPGPEGEKKTGPGALGPAPTAPTATGRPDVVAELVAKLQAQAEAELAAAAATEKSVAASLLAKAAAEAETKVAEIRSRLLEQEKSLREQLADAQNQAAAGEKGGGERALKLQAEITGLQKMVAELEKDAPQIKALYEEIASAGFATKASGDLQKFVDKTNEETSALEQMAAAYQQGPAAVQRAQDAAKIAPFEKQRSDLGELISGLRAAGAAGADVAKLQTAYDQLGASIDRAKASVSAFTAAEISEKIAKEKEELDAEAKSYALVASAALKSAEAQREAAARAEAIKFGAAHPSASAGQLDQVYDTALAKLDQQRAETIATAAAQYDLNASYDQEMEKLQEIRSFLASQGDSTIAIDTKIYEAKISHLLDYQRQVFDSQNQELLGEQKIYDLTLQLTEEWDRAASQVGTIGEKWRAMLNEVELQGDQLGSKIFSTTAKAFDDLSGTLARFLVTGKNGFGQMIQSWAEQLTKLSIQKGFSLLLGKIFGGPQTPAQGGGAPGSQGAGTPGVGTFAGAIGSIFGLGKNASAGPNGSATNPFYVVLSSAGGLGPGATTSTAAEGSPFSAFEGIPIVGPALKSIMGPLGGLFGGGSGGSGSSSTPDGSESNPFYTVSVDETGTPITDLLSGSGGGSGDLLGDMSSLFGGGGSSSGLGDDALGGLADLIPFFAEGGRPDPDQPAIVGEKGPEVFVPDRPGTIVPSVGSYQSMARSQYPDSRSSSSSAGSFAHIEQHIYGVTDADSFRRSQTQIHADQMQALSIAHYRNRSRA